MAKLTDYRKWVLAHWDRGGWSAPVRPELLSKKGQHEIKMLVKIDCLEPLPAESDFGVDMFRITDAGRRALAENAE